VLGHAEHETLLYCSLSGATLDTAARLMLGQQRQVFEHVKVYLAPVLATVVLCNYLLMLFAAFGHPVPSFARAFVARSTNPSAFCKRVDRAAILVQSDPAARRSQSFQGGLIGTQS
jgi:hypothetical protein